MTSKTLTREDVIRAVEKARAGGTVFIPDFPSKVADALGLAAVCQAKRKGDKEPIERVFSMDDARKAGLDGGPTWKKYPKLMLKYRARSQALKDKFPDSLNGVAIAEYDHHVLPSEESPKLADAAGELNAAFIGEEAAEGVYET